MNHRLSSRRDWLQTVAAASLVPVLPGFASTSRPGRDFHVCLAPPIVTGDAELVETVRDAGVSTVWIAGFLYGNKPYTVELIQRAHDIVERSGMRPELITVPLGHPGNSLGLPDGNSPPSHWRSARRPDGKEFVGTSIHAPATAENCDALRHLKGVGFRQCFVDDDFRLARGPGEIGGCYCAEHQARFLKGGGYVSRRWEELLADVQGRRLTPLLRAWLEFTGRELTSSFRAQKRAFRGELGIMVMYLGAEKAGIRLGDYRNALFRVGELMFDDGSFGSVKGKTDELFSVLFHRRFAEPPRAFSETTAYPADRLSAANMAAKLVISTIADVRHTMFMSGLTPFPRAHWTTLGPAMKRQAALHELVAGHKPRGPFKHLWGEPQRLVGDDRPFSLWLASGVPFEVVETPTSDGWNIASDFDAREVAMQRRKDHVRWVCRGSAPQRPEGAEVVGESLPEIFAFKHRIRDRLKGVPHIVEDHPAVCAWYPTARRALVWNLADEPCRLTIGHGKHRHEVPLGPLAAESVVLG